MTSTPVRPLGVSALLETPPPKLRGSLEIQGNVLAAFNKDHMTYRYIRFPDGAKGRAWIAGMLGHISVTAHVEDFNEQFSVARKAYDHDPGFSATWVGMSLTYEGLMKVAAAPQDIERDLKGFAALREGPAKRAKINGDTGDSAPSKWKFGSSSKTVHAVVLVASDTKEEMEERLKLITALDMANGVTLACDDDHGMTLPAPLTGHEHFGYKDGVSQPGVREFHREDPSRKGQRLGHPGTELLAPGEFVFGYPAESTSTKRTGPKWLNDGSLHVIRRLHQDVEQWNKHVAAAAAKMKPKKMDPSLLAACLVGRHKSGEPLARPSDPNLGLGQDRNDFDFMNDELGMDTPCAAHIRKTHPRYFSDKSHRIMRRGIPYGPVFSETTKNADRGLLFACYGTSIEEQFEFIQEKWSDNGRFAGGKQGAPTGVDPVIGPGGKVEIGLHTHHGELSMPRFVRTTGALYALTLSIRTLRLIASNKPLPRR